ncbi:MAG: LPS export ABC transporter permease LptG [Qingshengfaniella sp.]
MILHLYFARRFARTFLAVLLGFFAFMWLVELVEHVRRYGGAEAGFTQMALLAFLHVPSVLYQILSLVILLTAVTLFVNLARSSELVVARAAGRSALRGLAGPMVTAVVLGVLSVGLFNPFVASTQRHYETEMNRMAGEERVVSISGEGLWLRQGRPDSQTAIHARRANLDGTELYDATFFGFAPDGTPIYRASAREARLVDGAWHLSGVKRWRLEDEETNPEATATHLDSLRIPSDLTSDQIRDSFGTPSSIPIWQLPGFIHQLEAAGFTARAHRAWLQSELSRPFTFAAMVLIGAVFTLRPARMGRTGIMVLLAVMSGFAFYFAADLTNLMGESGQIPLWLGVWSAPLVAVCLALAGLLHLEDG